MMNAYRCYLLYDGNVLKIAAECKGAKLIVDASIDARLEQVASK